MIRVERHPKAKAYLRLHTSLGCVQHDTQSCLWVLNDVCMQTPIFMPSVLLSNAGWFLS